MNTENNLDTSSTQKSLNYDTKHWHRLHGAPLCRGKMKCFADDFVVEEQLGFELTGEGEHHLLWVEKLNTNTAFVAEQLAKFSGIQLRDISYAGRKDKFARTRQYFSVYQGKHQSPDWAAFEHPDIRILSNTRHNKKLRVGALKGNRFTLIIRELSALDEVALAKRMHNIEQFGVPNYYGQQRFGEMHTKDKVILNGNLDLGMRMAAGESIKNRNKRSMAISALRSYVFNEVASRRIEQEMHNRILLGDALQLSGSNSYFVVSKDDDISTLNNRLASQDVFTTAPLVGGGKLSISDEALQFEQAQLKQYPNILSALNGLGLKQERRAIMLYPSNIKWELNDDHLALSFDLPSGCFATSVLREIIE
jgi:tRNA pseudouridine13 synthase